MLDLLDIEGAIITIDAIGTQEAIVNKIVNKGGHYVLPVKENQKELRKEIKSQFDSYNNLYENPEIIHKKNFWKGSRTNRRKGIFFKLQYIKN